MDQAAPRLAFLLAAVALTFASPTPASAYASGITGRSGKQGGTCATCHGSTRPDPTVYLSGPAALSPGETGTFGLHLQANDAAHVAAGFNVAVDAGEVALDPAETDTRATGAGTAREITHASPRALDGGETDWHFSWTAPADHGVYTLYAAGNAVDLSGNTTGNRAVAVTLEIAVCAENEDPGCACFLDPGSAACDEDEDEDENGGDGGNGEENGDGGSGNGTGGDPVGHDPDDPGGCACAGPGTGPGLALVLLGAFLALRRQATIA